MKHIKSYSLFESVSDEELLYLLKLGAISIADVPPAQRFKLPHLEVLVETDPADHAEGYVVSQLGRIDAPGLWIDTDSVTTKRDEVSFFAWPQSTNEWDEESLEDFFWDTLNGPILNISIFFKD